MANCLSKLISTEESVQKTIKRQNQVTVGQFIALQKTIKFLENKYDESKKKIQQQVSKMQEKSKNQINQKKILLKKKFQQIKQLIDKKCTGGLKYLQQEEGQQLYTILGLKSAQKNLTIQSQEVENKLKLEKQSVLNNLKKITDQQAQRLRQRLPSKVNSEKWRQIFKDTFDKGEQKKYEKQIKKQQNQLMLRLNGKLQAQHYMQNFNNLLPTHKIQSLYQNSSSILNNVLQKMMKITTGRVRDFQDLL